MNGCRLKSPSQRQRGTPITSIAGTSTVSSQNVHPCLIVRQKSDCHIETVGRSQPQHWSNLHERPQTKRQTNRRNVWTRLSIIPQTSFVCNALENSKRSTIQLQRVSELERILQIFAFALRSIMLFRTILNTLSNTYHCVQKSQSFMTNLFKRAPMRFVTFDHFKTLTTAENDFVEWLCNPLSRHSETEHHYHITFKQPDIALSD